MLPTHGDMGYGVERGEEDGVTPGSVVRQHFMAGERPVASEKLNPLWRA